MEEPVTTAPEIPTDKSKRDGANRLYEYSTVDNTVEILNYKVYMLKNVQNYMYMYILYIVH